MQCCAGALERVFLPFGWHGFRAARVHLSGRAYRECECPYNSCVLRGSGRTCTKPVKNHMICAFLLARFCGHYRGERTKKSARLQDDRATNKQTNKQTSSQASKQTSKQANKQTNKQAVKQASKQQTNKQTNKQTTNQTSKQKK